MEDNAPMVARFAARFDGNPLAIELAAPRARACSLSTRFAERLDTPSWMTGGSRNRAAPPADSQGMIDWSFNLLSPAERALLRRLSIFK